MEACVRDQKSAVNDWNMTIGSAQVSGHVVVCRPLCHFDGLIHQNAEFAQLFQTGRSVLHLDSRTGLFVGFIKDFALFRRFLLQVALAT
jgi:hypothetical protein